MAVCSITGDITLEGQFLIEGLSLEFDPGWTCLLGPSGSGKSTLLRLIAGLKTAAKLEGSSTAPDVIGWMPQQDLLQPRFSALENVRLASRLAGNLIDKSKAEELLASVGLAGKETAKPEALSGGQRQRVALARALSENSSLVLLDEPFSALDPLTRISMQDLAWKSLHGKTVVMVTHDPTEALRLGNRILMISQQRIVEIPALKGPFPVPVKDEVLAVAAAKLMSEMADL